MYNEQQASSSATHCSSQPHNKWIEIQDSLKKKLITQDYFNWRLPFSTEVEEKEFDEVLRYVGGVDLSFSKDDSSIACGTLVVVDLKTLEVVHQDSSFVKLDVPYIPGFLAFREAPILLELLEKTKKTGNLLYPQLHHVDGLTLAKVRHLLELEENSSGDVLSLIGDSGRTLGAALQSLNGSLKPIFVSVGHRISLDTAIKIVKLTCRFRIPEPIRQADISSKECLRKLDRKQ